MTRRQAYDYVIIGGGSAGCVLANRLSVDPAATVCLIEAGSRANHIGIRMPAALTFPIESDRYNWKFESEPEPALNGRRVGQARGRGLGGSSSINGMVFVRGDRRDYDSWREFGIAGWDFADCLPYFKKLETFEGGRDPMRGGDGPVNVVRSRADHPFYQAFLEAGREFGLRDAGDYNNGDPEGVHVTQATIRDGVRCSMDLAYLRPVRQRANLTVLTHAHVERIDFEGKIASGVTIARRGQRERIDAAREVILCAGAIGSPHLLMLSGVGDRRALADHGINSVAHVPGVGQDLQDHVVAPLRFTSIGRESLAAALGLTGRLKLGLEWMLRRTGLGATNFFEVGAFFKTSTTNDYYDLQHEFLPFLADFQNGRVEVKPGLQYFVSLMRPRSRGRVTLQSGKPRDKPAIIFNYLADPEDIRDMIDGVRQTQAMAAQPAWDRYRGEGVDIPDQTASDPDVAAWLRRVANTEHHPTSTCRMGSDDAAVTDADGRVRDVARLRIVDGSILPRIPSANVNAPIIMAAEKIADAIVREAAR